MNDGAPKGRDPSYPGEVPASGVPFTRDVASPLGSVFRTTTSRILAWSAMAALAGALLYAEMSPLWAIAALALVLLVSNWPKRVAIASDGVVLSWLGARQFVPFARVAAVASDPNGVSLVLRSGEHVSITRDDSGTALGARLREALEAFRTGGSDATVAALAARGTRAVPEWLAELRRLRSGYRGASVDDETLLRVVEDPAAPADARAGAVVLLRATLDEERRARIRVASSLTGEERLRDALYNLMEAREDDLPEALARVRRG